MTDLDAQAAACELTAPLRRAQFIHVIRTAALSVLWAVALGLLSYRLLPSLAQLAGRDVDAASISFFVFAPVLIVGLSLAFGSPPDLGTLARRADRLYRAGERLATALEQKPIATGPASAVLTGLLRDAATYSARIAPSRLVHPLGGGVPIAIAALLVAMFAFALVPPPAPQVPALMVETPVESVDADSRTESVKALANVLSEDAEERDNDFLKKVADAVGQLAQRKDLPQQAYRDALSGLLDNARLAYGRTPPNWLLQNATTPDNRYGLANDQNFAALAQRAAEANQPDPNAGSGEELVPELLSEQNLQNPSVPAPLPGQLRIAPQPDIDMFSSGSDVGGRNAKDPLTGQAAAGRGGQAPDLGNQDASVDMDSATARLVGGATQSGKGASRTAGGGTQDLDDPEKAAQATAPSQQDEVLLPPGDYTKGKRIRVQVAPKLADPASSAGTGAGFVGTTAAGAGVPTPVNRDLPSIRDQAVFSRFFTHNEGDGV